MQCRLMFLKQKNGKLIQQGVKFGDGFEFVDLPQNDSRFDYEAKRILDDGIRFEEDYISEFNTWIRPWIKSLRDSLSQGVVFM